jgi:hypothetical protein
MNDPRLLELAKRYTCWLVPEEAMDYPQRVIARIMDMGTFEDIHELVSIVGEDSLRQALQTAEAGQFRPWVGRKPTASFCMVDTAHRSISIFSRTNN